VYNIGIDLSLTSTGVVVSLNHQLLFSHCIRTKPKEFKNYNDRIVFINSIILEICKRYKPTIINLEAPSYGSRSSRLYQMFGSHFFTAMVLEKKYNTNLIPPSELKKFATNKGNANKELMFDNLPKEIKNEVEKEYSKNSGLYDITDAYWLSIFKKINKEK
jgi:Holliday junction resolvasome RuvABC endonuclease subunit